MIISVVCPGCRTTYRVQDALRGKPMRCLTPTCRRVFVIDDAPPAPKTAVNSGSVAQSGAVGDMIPLLPVEEVNPDPVKPPLADMIDFLPAEEAAPDLPLEVLRPAEAVPAPDWRTDAPPPRRGKQTDPSLDTLPPPRKRPSRPTEMDGPKVVHEAGAWEAPPVRRDPADEEPLPEVGDAVIDEPPVPRSSPDFDDSHPRPATRWARWIVVPLAILTVGVLSAGVVILILSLRVTEEKLAKDADEEFTKNRFATAVPLYEKLLEPRFGTSENHAFYQFRKDISELRKRLNDPSDDLVAELDHAEQFLKDNAGKPEMPDHAAALSAALAKVFADFADREVKALTDDKPLGTLARAEQVAGQLKAVPLPKGSSAPGWAKMDESFAALRLAVARMNERNAILAALRKKATPNYEGILDVDTYLKQIEGRFPDLPGSDEVRKLREDQYAGHRGSVRYDATGDVKPATAREESEPAILLAPLLGGTPTNAGRRDIALALVRGVLYAVAADTGHIRWARRVGIDSTTLPVRVRARAGIQELLLVLSSDNATLTAVDLNGEPQWRYQLDRAALGRPAIVDQRAFLATYSGEVHEIELTKGKLLGKYHLGQRLTLGGTVETDPKTKTSRLYIAADDGCVYVLNVTTKQCEQILYSRHPAGSLRGEPIVVPAVSDEAPGYLILNQATGLDSVRLRVFDLPLTNGAKERALKIPAGMDGWTWFDPYTDAEKVVLLSDAGRMGMFGIRQAQNNDQPLFPMLADGGMRLESLLFPGAKPMARPRGRAEIAQVEGDELWVLAADRLQRLRLAWGAAVGPQVVNVWGNSVEVGAPLHATQTLEDPAGNKSLVTVTQPSARSCAWVTSSDDNTGKMQWRRQLGLVCQQEPVLVRIDGQMPMFLALDQAASLFAIDPDRYQVQPGTKWLTDSRNEPVAGSLPENPSQPPIVLHDAKNNVVYTLNFPSDGREMVVRQVKPGVGRELDMAESKARLLAALAGRPALVGSTILLPLIDGSLARVKLPMAKVANVEGGPPWRTDRVSPETRCPIVALSDDRFVTTDGSRQLAVWEWGAGMNIWAALPAGREEATLELPDRILDVVLVPGPVQHLAVTDTAGTVTLLEVKANGALEVKKTWKLRLPLSNPFVRETAQGVRIGVVVDRSTLAWLDPAKGDDPAWTYKTPGDDGLVGQPQVVGNMLVVADQSGLIVGLDAATGKTVGDGYQLRGSLAPATSPILFQPNRLLAPLSDGTLMLLDPLKLTIRRAPPP